MTSDHLFQGASFCRCLWLILSVGAGSKMTIRLWRGRVGKRPRSDALMYDALMYIEG